MVKANTKGKCEVQKNSAKNYVIGAALVFGAYYAGNLVTHTFALPIPGPLIGLLFLLALLFIFPIVEHHVANFALTPLKHMSLLFVPAVLGVSLYWSDIQQNALAIVLAIVVTTSLCLGTTGWISQRLFSKKNSISKRVIKEASKRDQHKNESTCDD